MYNTLLTVDCGSLSDPPNGSVNHTAGTTLGQTATYSCNTCYNLVGDRTRTLSVLKAWVGLFLVKIDMLSWWLHFSNTQQCVGTIYILWIEVCLVIKKKVATVWKTAHVSKRTANGKPHPAITWAQKAQHLDITNRGLSGSIINYSLSSNFLPGRIA